MSFLDAKSFTFDGKSSDLFNLLICWIGSEPDLDTNGLNRTTQKGELNNVRLTSNYYGIKYDDNIEFDFYIVNKDKHYFTKEESMAINNWLTSSTIPKLLRFNDNDIPSIHYYAVCTSVKDVVINNHNAKELHFETNSPFGFMYPIERTFLVEGTENLIIENLSDTVDGLYYPIVKIVTNSDTDIIIENLNDKKSVTINMAELDADESGDKMLCMDCKKMTLTDANNKLIPMYKVGWDGSYKSPISSENNTSMIEYIYWFRLLKGTNNIKITGNCTITFTYEFPRKVGCL